MSRRSTKSSPEFDLGLVSEVITKVTMSLFWGNRVNDHNDTEYQNPRHLNMKLERYAYDMDSKSCLGQVGKSTGIRGVLSMVTGNVLSCTKHLLYCSDAGVLWRPIQTHRCIVTEIGSTQELQTHDELHIIHVGDMSTFTPTIMLL